MHYLVFLSIFTLLGKLLRLFYNEDCLRCGVFLGSFVAIFKVCDLNIAFQQFCCSLVFRLMYVHSFGSN